MKKNLEIDVPKNADTEVQRVRGLKKSIFMRTRIALLSLVLVLGLSVASTFAYYGWTANQTPNRASAGEVGFSIVEYVDGAEEVTANEKVDAGQTVKYGVGNKKVKVRASDTAGIANQRVRVSFIPERLSKEKDADETKYASEYMSEDWSASVQQTKGEGDVVTEAWIECDDVKLYINPSWADEWTYSNGSFTRKASLEPGESSDVLLLGMTMSSSASSYYEVKVNVIAEAIQEHSEVTWAEMPADSSSTPSEEVTPSE